MGGGDGESQGETDAAPDKAEATLERGKTRMKNQNENAAVSDVTARMRTEASILAGVGYQRVTAETVSRKLREFADSIDAAVSKTETTTPGNNAAMREALLKAIILLKVCEWPYDTPMQDVAEVIDEIEKASSAPPRNCDLFGGDYKMLHTAWFDWTGSPSGQNPDGTPKMAFGEWLLAFAGKRGAV